MNFITNEESEQAILKITRKMVPITGRASSSLNFFVFLYVR